MRSFRSFFLVLAIALAAIAAVWLCLPAEYTLADDQLGKLFDEMDPDIPLVPVKMDKADYRRARDEQLALWRGLDTAKKNSRTRALLEMERREAELDRTQAQRGERPTAAERWRAIGPAPIPFGAGNAYSGRTVALAVHPTDPNIVYAGAAQGGIYRSTNGGANWTPLLDDALTLSIGSIAISPADPSTVFVGTGETSFSQDSFFGVGVYRITNADTNPVVTGPLNKNAANADVFTGRGVSEILLHPTDPNKMIVTTAQGIAGLGASTAGANLPDAGVFRSINAMSADPVFEKLPIQGTLAAGRSISDAAADPADPNRVLIGVVGIDVGGVGDGGVYLTTNAYDTAPVFARTQPLNSGTSAGRVEFAVNRSGGVLTVYAAAGTSGGTVYKSVNGGASFTPAGGGAGFCSPQCFYDIAVAVDPADPNKLYLGGSPALVFGRSLNGGASFLASSNNLHVDTHAIAIAPSNPNIVYFASDGGVWRTNDVNATPIVWNTLNNSSYSATQFQSIALHPTERNYTLGGTQDNGTQFLAPDGATWILSDGGDGGFAVIDQNSTSPTNVTAYHTYYNSLNSTTPSQTLIGYVRSTSTVGPGDPVWSSFRGCSGGSSNNGINCSDPVLFYAPMVHGPGDPSTLYFGTVRLYRSADRGATMNDVSGVLPARISAIAVSGQDDNVRVVGTSTGGIYVSTTAGATSMTNITGPIPPRYVGRVAIDPTNADVAYVTLNGFGLGAGQHVWKTANLLSPTPTWTAAGVGIPDVPVNAFAIDPVDTRNIFAGTDIGVFRSTNGGTSWEPFSDGLPRVAVFGMEFHRTHRVLRIATHGRGMYEYDFAARPTLFDYDGDRKADLSVRRPADNVWHLLRATAGYTAMQWGVGADKMAPADYDGDGRTDVAVFRPSEGVWYVHASATQTFQQFNWGQQLDVPVPADRDGDGRADLVIYRPSNNVWYTRFANGTFLESPFGQAGDVPVRGDFDGDLRWDMGVYRPSNNNWYIIRSSLGYFVQTWGEPGDQPITADFDGDGATDTAVFRPSTGQWFLSQTTAGFTIRNWGQSGDIPVPADYDGDGRADPAIFRPSEGNWYIAQSTAGILIQNFGMIGDVPTQSAFSF